uniref:tRNA dimethylallyltransferase n=1 Tax=candidate division WWE3 bacterium TaxID=2053526 RepID=A0A7C4XN38_UNCKA
MKKIPVIVGPTSSGKTSLAIKLARRFSGQLISADSRQVFKKMNIGTGKVPVDGVVEARNFINYWTLDDVVVYGYDLVEPDEFFSAYDYRVWAQKKLKEVSERHLPILVGGTGFYLDAVLGQRSLAHVPPDPSLREELEPLDVMKLGERLKWLSLETYKKIDKSNKRRLIRAIEVAVNSQKQEDTNIESSLQEHFYIGLTGSREQIYSRADSWVESVWDGGLLDETKNLISLGCGESRPMNGLIYKTVREFLSGGLVEEKAKQQVKYDLHSYIRRQQTWFSRNKEIAWFDISEPDFFQKVSNHVESKVDG